MKVPGRWHVRELHKEFFCIDNLYPLFTFFNFFLSCSLKIVFLKESIPVSFPSSPKFPLGLIKSSPWKSGKRSRAIAATNFSFHAVHGPSFSSVQSLSRVRLFETPWIASHQASLSITNSRSSLRPTSIESVMPSSHLILCRPLLLLHPIPPRIRVFSNESTLRMRWPKYFSISPSKEIPGLISFRMDWLDLLAVQGTLKSLLQHHSSKPSILRCSDFFTVQLSHPYMTTGKTIALTRWTFVGKVMSLLFNMLSRLVVTFLPRNKHLLISWLHSPSAVIPNSFLIKYGAWETHS